MRENPGTYLLRFAAPVRWLRRVVRSNGPERELALQAAKTAVAVSLAWLVAGWVLRTPQPFVAPYAAIYVINDTVYRSLTSAVQQMLALIIGLVLAYAAARLVDAPIAALAVAMLIAVPLGHWRRLGGNGEWVAITALVMLTYGTATEPGYLLVRLGQSAIGALIGLAVNLVLLPPMHLDRAHRALARLGTRISEALHALAEGLRADWTEQDVRSWLADAASLRASARAARQAVGRGAESVRFNPRRSMTGRNRALPTSSTNRALLSALDDVVDQCQRMGEVLLLGLESDHGTGATPEEVGRGLAELVDGLADAVAASRTLPAGTGDLRDSLREQLVRVRAHHEHLAPEEQEPIHPENRSVRGGLVLAVQRAVQALLRVVH